MYAVSLDHAVRSLQRLSEENRLIPVPDSIIASIKLWVRDTSSDEWWQLPPMTQKLLAAFYTATPVYDWEDEEEEAKPALAAFARELEGL
jgi:hypothetical protein